MITQYEPSKIDIRDVQAMSDYKRADIAAIAMQAMNSFTLEELKSEDELPSRLIGACTVFPRRVGRTRIVFLCYHNGKLMGSIRVETAKA